jgi:hypothetical protein
MSNFLRPYISAIRRATNKYPTVVSSPPLTRGLGAKKKNEIPSAILKYKPAKCGGGKFKSNVPDTDSIEQ